MLLNKFILSLAFPSSAGYSVFDIQVPWSLKINTVIHPEEDFKFKRTGSNREKYFP
jgi:hypothetical protein